MTSSFGIPIVAIIVVGVEPENVPSTRTWFVLVSKVHLFAIDDLGEEPKEVLSYGNAITPVVDILEDRYRKREITLITTNLDADGIKEKYGVRVADRLREMMMIIPFTNPSYR